MDKLGSNSPIRPQVGVSKTRAPSAPIKKPEPEKAGTPPSDLVQITGSPTPVKAETAKPQDSPKPQVPRPEKPAVQNAPTTIAMTEDPVMPPATEPGKEAPKTFEQQMAELMRGLAQRSQNPVRFKRPLAKSFRTAHP